MSIINSVIMTPQTYKEQLLIKLKSLIQNRSDKSYDFKETLPVHDITAVNGRSISEDISTRGIVQMPDGEVYYIDDIGDMFPAASLCIESLWDMYMACEPIYNYKFVDYSTSQVY